jgi:hypothetical protein
MTTCPKCHAELTEEMLFCPECGKAVAPRAAGPEAGAQQPTRRHPLLRARDALLITGLVVLAAAGIWIAYVAGDPMRYIKHVAITVDGAENKVRKVRSYWRDEVEEREVVEVRGTVNNRGNRAIRELTALVSLKNAEGEVVGSCERPLSTSAVEEPYWHRNGGSFPAGATTRFVLDVYPVSNDWVAEKTQVIITDLDLN